MTVRPHPRYDEFERWFADHLAKAIAVRDDFFRVAGPAHTTAREIVSGIGAWIAGGRWNAPESMKVVYLSTAPETAMAEANEHFRYFNLPLSQAMPKVTVAVRVELERVLDLSDQSVAAALPESMKTFLTEDWRAVLGRDDEATTQALGRGAFGAGFQGLLVPSKPVRGGINLLVFPERLRKNNFLNVLKPELLEKLGKAG